MKNFLFSNGYAITFDPLGAKRFLILLAFLLVPSFAIAQDNDKSQSEGTLLIVPRFEVNPYFEQNDRSWGFDFGATSLYTVFDGNLGDWFSFSFSNHWFAFQNSFDNTKALYRNTWRADESNWVDWANVSFHLGNFALTLGKDYIHFGTFEIDAYDFDAHGQLNSMFWFNYQVYQWGGSLSWTSSDDNTTLMLQMTSDQTMEKPFGSKKLGDYAYNLFGSHSTDEVTVMGSISHCSVGWLGAFGVQVALSDALTLTGDAYISKDYFATTAKLDAELNDHFGLFVKGGFDTGENEWILEGSGIVCGLGFHWYPLCNNKDLRVHALYSYDSVYNEMVMSAGITYALNLKLF